MERKLTLIPNADPNVAQLLESGPQRPCTFLAILLRLIYKNGGINVVFKAHALALVYLLRGFPNNLDQSNVSNSINNG